MKAHTRTILSRITMLAVVAAAWAPDHAGAQDDLIVVTGAVELSGSGEITVAGYGIAPSGAFKPSSLDEGDIVIVTGVLLPDGQTVRAESLQLFDSP